MKILVLYAHPNPKSFNHAILETVLEELRKAGHSCEVADLYAIRFNPVLTREELVGLMEGKVLNDTREQQEKISCAEALVVIHPIWWTGPPAILKGWIDRVLTLGFAYCFDEKQGTLNGLLKQKKAWIINTAGASEKDAAASGMTSTLHKMEALGVFRTCGIEDVQHTVFYNVPMSDEKTREDYLKRVRELAKAL